MLKLIAILSTFLFSIFAYAKAEPLRPGQEFFMGGRVCKITNIPAVGMIEVLKDGKSVGYVTKQDFDDPTCLRLSSLTVAPNVVQSAEAEFDDSTASR